MMICIWKLCNKADGNVVKWRRHILRTFELVRSNPARVYVVWNFTQVVSKTVIALVCDVTILCTYNIGTYLQRCTLRVVCNVGIGRVTIYTTMYPKINAELLP
jgi:hypothetical protein